MSCDGLKKLNVTQTGHSVTQTHARLEPQEEAVPDVWMASFAFLHALFWQFFRKALSP
jgi:hypothetical protein